MRVPAASCLVLHHFNSTGAQAPILESCWWTYKDFWTTTCQSCTWRRLPKVQRLLRILLGLFGAYMVMPIKSHVTVLQVDFNLAGDRHLHEQVSLMPKTSHWWISDVKGWNHLIFLWTSPVLLHFECQITENMDVLETSVLGKPKSAKELRIGHLIKERMLEIVWAERSYSWNNRTK